MCAVGTRWRVAAWAACSQSSTQSAFTKYLGAGFKARRPEPLVVFRSLAEPSTGPGARWLHVAARPQAC